MEEVSLQEMLAAREHRSALQTRLLQQYKKSLISFTLNIPGPVKVPDGVPQAFASGPAEIEALLKDRLVLVQHMETIKEKTGYEAFYCIDANPEFIKTLMVTLEDQDRLGRLFDIDVIRPDGSKVSREELGRRQGPACCVKNLPMPATAAAVTAWQSSRPRSAIS